MTKVWSYLKKHAISTLGYIGSAALIVDGIFRRAIYDGDFASAETEVGLGFAVAGSSTAYKVAHEDVKAKNQEKIKELEKRYKEWDNRIDVDLTVKKMSKKRKTPPSPLDIAKYLDELEEMESAMYETVGRAKEVALENDFEVDVSELAQVRRPWDASEHLKAYTEIAVNVLEQFQREN
jgi:hypothetical protein